MKKLVALAVAVAAVPALAGPTFAQTEKKPAMSPAVTEAEKKPAMPAPAAREVAVKNVAGEIVAMDQTARTFTVSHMADRKPAQMTFSVEDPTVFAQFKRGDHVKITYAEMGDKRLVRSIVKG
jgi:Cu/Ag efflux protein CusF